MEKLHWKDSYNTGVELVDEQHKKLVSLIGSFYDALVGDKDDFLKNRVEILKELVDYTVYHFSCEEKLFDEIDYYAKDPHVLQHTMFIKQVEEQAADLLSSDTEKGEEFYSFLTIWLLGHISQSDKLFCTRYISFLQDGE